MGTLIYILFISIFFPLLLMMLLVEEKARLPIAFMMAITKMKEKKLLMLED